MIETSTLYDNRILFRFQEQQRLKIEELQKMIQSLQEEIKVIQEFNERLQNL